MPRRSERRKTQKDAPVSGAGSSSGSNGSSVNKGNGKGKSGTNDSGSPGVRSLRPRPGKPKAPNGAKAGKEKVNRNGQKKKSPKKDSSSYISPTGEEYRPGDFAFVDSQRPDLPYHICKILQFKSPRRDVLIAEVVWFFRVQEVPESLYLLLQEDRKADQVHESYFDPRVTQRELFIAHNVDTHSTLLFRGRCQVHEVDGTSSINHYLDMENTFFYCLGYTPETRRLTREKEKEDYIPLSHQAVIPDLISAETEGDSPANGALDTPTEDDRDSHADLVWRPVAEDTADDERLLMYLTAARSIALHAGLCISGYLSQGNLAACSDETTQHAYDVLYKKNFDVQAALQDLVKAPRAKQTIEMKYWSADESKLFTRGVKQHGKHFHRIQKEYFPNRSVTELNEYYYYWKQSAVGRSSRTYRRQSKLKHIRLWKQMGKPQPPVNEREMVDLSSCDEDEEENYRDMSLYACQLCYSRESSCWHHAGVGSLLLCADCQDHFFRLGEMKPVPERGTPPPILFKDYHQAMQLSLMESGRRNTRSNGASQQSKKGLRSGKAYKSSESGSGEEESGTDTESSDDSTYADKEMHMSKLQRRKSILTGMTGDEEEEEETQLPPKKNRKLVASKEEGDKAGGSEDLTLQSCPNKGAATFVKTSASAVSNEKEEKQISSSLSDSNDEEDFRSPPTPPSFTRVGGAPIEGKTSARTSLNYIHPQNAKYLMKAPVRPKEKGTRSALTTPNAAHHSASRSSAATAPTAFQFPSAHIPHHHSPVVATTTQALPSLYHTATLPAMYSHGVMGHQEVHQHPEQIQVWERLQHHLAAQQQQQMSATKVSSANSSSSHGSHYSGTPKNPTGSVATPSMMEEAMQQQQHHLQQQQHLALMAQGQVQPTLKLHYDHAARLAAASAPNAEFLQAQMQSMAESMPHAVYPPMEMFQMQTQAHPQLQAASQSQQQQQAVMAQQMAAQYAMMQSGFLPFPCMGMITPEQYQAYSQQYKLLEQMNQQQQQQPEMAATMQAAMAQYMATQGQQPRGTRSTPIHKPVIVNTT